MASINFVTAHDGFTLRDLVSYNDKHNEANGEDSNDGESHNRSWNHGVEGPTDDPEILELRSRQQRNFITTLLLSQGVPMLLHGDEAGRTQDGNNNTYAQDSEISWMHWDDVDQPLVEFTASVSRLRRDHPTFRRKRFFTGTTVRTGSGDGERLNDIVWLHPEGHPIEDGDWTAPGARSIGMYLNGARHPRASTPAGQQILDDHFLLYFNASADDVPLTLPPEEYAAAWDVEIDTAGTERDDAAAGRRSDVGAGRAQRARAARAHRGRGDARLLGGRLGRGLPGLTRRQGRMSGSPRGTTTAMRTPVSTYRLQITAGFDLSAAARTLTYLHDLGVDWVYLSPLLEAEPGSDHGYDVVAHDRVDPARGGAEGLAQLSAEARRLGMGVLVDIVPNHVGVATPHVNAWWWDLLDAWSVVAPRRRVRRGLGPRRRPRPDPRGRRR